jgi:hypothetical protein
MVPRLSRLEGKSHLEINREKTRVVDLAGGGESLQESRTREIRISGSMRGAGRGAKPSRPCLAPAKGSSEDNHRTAPSRSRLSRASG